MLSYSEIVNPTDERVENILKAGEKHFKQFGFRKSSIGEICADAGISKPTFYKYFDRKETLFFAVIIYLRRDWYTTYMERIKGLSTATEKLSAFLEVSEEFLRVTPILTQSFIQSPGLYKSWAGHPLNIESYLASVDFVEKIIMDGIASDEFRVSDPRRTAHVIVLASTLFVIFEPQMPGTSKKSDASFLFDLLQHGIVKRH
ncbi:TetR/AcrR family transcriptional regulator [candidate division WOR-3 bacterium]|nr:TetR/AcrR family transcriptional regulator [candidate division WOR-3 bacterium]